MRSYRLYSKAFSPTHDSIIEDEAFRKVYQIEGAALAPRYQYVMVDHQGREVARLRRKFFTLLAESFSIARPDRPTVKMRRKLLSDYRFHFIIDVKGGHPLEAISRDGDRAYTVEDQGQLVASITRADGQASDAYLVQIKDGADQELILLCAMALDLGCHDHHRDTEAFSEESRRISDWFVMSLIKIIKSIFGIRS